MKKLLLFFKPLLIFFAIVMLMGIVFFSIHYTINPLKGHLTSATITKHSSGPEKSIIITNTQKLAELEELLKIETTPFQLNSMKGYPEYHLAVTYTDGSTGSFSFSKIEWAGEGQDGHTPPYLLEYLTNNGL